MRKILIIAGIVTILIAVGMLTLFSRTPSQSLEKKAKELQIKLPQWVMSHPGKADTVQELMQQMGIDIGKKDFVGAEKIADQVLALLKEGIIPEQSPNTTGSPPATSSMLMSEPIEVRLSKISSQADIIFHEGGHIWSMDKNGKNLVQITFGEARKYEHVAASYDHRYIISNVHDEQGRSHLWIYNLEKNTEARLLPDFYDAGDGAVTWDLNGYIYFVGKRKKTEGLRDLFKVKPDGTSLIQLTKTSDRQECDPGVSQDGTLVAYCINFPEPERNTSHTEIWVINSNGTNPHQVYVGGEILKASVHDPELSSDNTRVIFSKVNSYVKSNFPNDANTAHDIWSIKLDGTDMRRLTAPGPISIVPNVQDDLVVYTELSEKDSYTGVSVVSLDGTDQLPRRLHRGGAAAKWIPKTK